MRMNRSLIVCAGAFLAGSSAAWADFSGQPILGPLNNGSVVAGTTAGDADDNDGFDSGIHIFNIWDGGDDVWRLIWPGGDMTVTLDSLGGSDNDLFVYSPGSLDSTGDYSTVGAHDVVTIPGAGAGDYFINIDSTFFSEGSYQLTITPEPGTAGLMLLGLIVAGRSRRGR